MQETVTKNEFFSIQKILRANNPVALVTDFEFSGY